MRIALVHPKFDRSGGAERYAWSLARGLADRGHEVHAFGRWAAGLPGGVAFHRVPSVPFGRALKTYSFWALTERLVRPERFDVVQGFGKTTCQTVHRTGGGVHRAYLERAGKARPGTYDRVVLRIEERLFSSPRLRAVICPSRWVAGEVERHHPAASGRLRVVPNGVDTGLFRPADRRADRRRLAGAAGVPEEAPWVLFVATNFRLKGLDLAVKALAGVPGAHLIVVGGSDPRPFAAAAAEAGCADRVRFVGAQADMAPWYRAADVLLHPTRYDPFANVCLEALACGTPVVTTGANGAADVLEEAPGAGRVSDPRPEPLARAVEELIGAGAGARAAARALAERLDLGAHLEAVERVYLEALREGPR